MRNHVGKRLKPVPSKNIENWPRRRNFRELGHEKNFAGIFGDSPKTEKVGKLFFSKIKIELPYLCFDTILVYFGPQGDAQCVHQYHIREDRKSLGPPPLIKEFSIGLVKLSIH